MKKRDLTEDKAIKLEAGNGVMYLQPRIAGYYPEGINLATTLISDF